MSGCYELDMVAKRVIDLGINGLLGLELQELKWLYEKVTEDQNKLRQACWGRISKELFSRMDASCSLAKLLIIACMKERQMNTRELPETQLSQAELIAFIDRLRSMLAQMDVKEAVEAVTEEDVSVLVRLQSKLATLKTLVDPNLAKLIEETYGILIRKAKELLGEVLLLKPGIIYGYLVTSMVTKSTISRDVRHEEASSSSTAQDVSPHNSPKFEHKDEDIGANLFRDMSKYIKVRSADEVSDWEIVEVARRHGYITETILLQDLRLESIADARKIIERITKGRGIFHRKDPLAYEVKDPFAKEKRYVIESALSPREKDIVRQLRDGEKTLIELLTNIPNCDLWLLEHILTQMERKGIVAKDPLTGKYSLRF